MSRYAAFVLFLAIGLGFSRAADMTLPTDDPETSEPSEAPFTDTTTTTTTTTTMKTETTTTTTATPTTTPTTTATPTTTTTATPTTTTTGTTTTTTTGTTTTTTTGTTTTNTTGTTTTNTTETPTTTTKAPNTTSSAPNTTSTVPTTTTPTPLPNPTSHLYKYKYKTNNVTCLMVKFGLRIGYTGDNYEEMNLQYTNETSVDGYCGENRSELVIHADPLIIKLSFENDTKKFSLYALNVTGKTSSGVAFTQANSNLSLWQASLGTSYMCTKKQNYTITNQLMIFTFELQVQPFGVKKESFSTAQECSMDDTSILIPIVVGAALAGLILIVVIAYVIGRRKTYVGYQTL